MARDSVAASKRRAAARFRRQPSSGDGVPNSMAHAARLLVGMLLLSMGLAARAQDVEKPRASAAPEVLRSEPPRDSFIVLPLHIHVLSCKSDEDLDCKLADEDIHRVLGKINGVWHQAGIHWRLASLTREEACNVEMFTDLKAKAKAHERPVPLEAFAATAPPDAQKPAGLHVFYIHQFAVNGVYLGGRTCFVKETAQLRPVEGGIDEPLPRVTSHELGHALGLPHRQNTFNLMASGTTGTLLSVAEIEIARATAKKVEGALTVSQCESAIAAKGSDSAKNEETESIRNALKELPPPQVAPSSPAP